MTKGDDGESDNNVSHFDLTSSVVSFILADSSNNQCKGHISKYSTFVLFTESFVNGTIRASFEYQGQKCSASSRVYVPQSLWPQVRTCLIVIFVAKSPITVVIRTHTVRFLYL